MHELADRLLERVRETFEGERQERLLEFLSLYVDYLPSAFRKRLAEEDLFTFLLERHEFLEEEPEQSIRVQIGRPTERLSALRGGFTTVETRLPDCTFIVRTLKEFFRKRGLRIHAVLHPVVGIVHEGGRVLRIDPLGHQGTVYSHIYLHISRVSPEEWPALEAELTFRLETLLHVNESYRPCLQQMAWIRSELEEGGLPDPDEGPGMGEVLEFLDWLVANNFIFLGYGYIPVAEKSLTRSLGILDFEGYADAKEVVNEIARSRLDREELLAFYRTDCVCVVKSETQFRYLGIRDRDESGRTRGEHVFVGLLSSNSMNERNSRIPIIAGRMQEMLGSLRYRPGSYAYKKMFGILNSFPNEGLFYASADELLRVSQFIRDAEAIDQAGVFIWCRRPGSQLEIVCVLPRPGFSEALRGQVTAYLCEYLKVPRLRSYVRESDDEGPLRMHFYVNRYREGVSTQDLDRLREEVGALLETWDERVQRLLLARHPLPKPGHTLRLERGGGVTGVDLWVYYGPLFSDRYRRTQSAEVAVRDIESMLTMQREEVPHRVTMDTEGGQEQTVLRVLSRDELILNDVVPILEQMGLRARGELADRFESPGAEVVHLASFECMGADRRPMVGRADLDRLAQIVLRVLEGELPVDPLLGLGHICGLTWRQVLLLIAYRNYFLQLFREYAAQSVGEALLAHPEAARSLVELFEARFRLEGPPLADRLEGEVADCTRRFLDHLDAVDVIAEDVILRLLYSLVQSTVRTSFFRPDAGSVLAFKIDSRQVESMPRPRPRYEIFVHGPHMEGIHLRGGRVARGGLRASDRVDDYRTEVLGLLKAQMTKNSIIVPVGAKGGFVVRDLPPDRARAEEVVRTEYRHFIGGLLDVTDNIEGGVVRAPDGVVCHDGEDPYLVVAADKGTARFSDTANEISEARGFWLGDAFASGGSEGYDHKGLGITARGAWVSVERHFRELGIDPGQDAIRVIGVGDMSGDVFGNGLLQSERICLVAAFNHRHIFLDPDPDPGASFAERRRLFELPRSSWSDYDRSLLSPGGGVFERNAKRIELSEQVAHLLGAEPDCDVSGPELVRLLLRVEADLLWLGGIGTYVKATDELHVDVGDKANDAVRIDADELRVRVVGEGANLGLTARSRTEFCLAGGKCNTDSIDNSAGVDCSDHEVNLKIFLAQLQEGDEVADRSDRNQILRGLEETVAGQCLRNNYLQTALLSLEELRSRRDVESFVSLLTDLEERAGLDRTGECIPRNSELRALVAEGGRISRNVLAVLTAYAKNDLQSRLLETSLPDHPFFVPWIRDYFPEALVERFGDHLVDHRLRREIVAMVVANRLVNQAGSTFLHDRQRESRGGLEEMVIRYFLLDDLLGGPDLRSSIHALDQRVPAASQYEALLLVEDSLGGILRWWNWNESEWKLSFPDLAEVRGPFEEGLVALAENGSLFDVQPEARGVDAWMEEGFGKDLARRLERLPCARWVLTLVDSARRSGHHIREAAGLFGEQGRTLLLFEFERILREQPLGTLWEKRFHANLQRELAGTRDRFLHRGLASLEEGAWSLSEAEAEVIDRLGRSLHSIGQSGGHQRIPLFVLLEEYQLLLGSS